jgi:hypothetical protein
MKVRRTLVLACALVCLCGCGQKMLKTKGRVLKDGAPFLPGEGEFIRVTFVPLVTGKKVEDYFVAEVNNKEGTFVAAGKDLRGIPPGKYRVAIELDKGRSDLLQGKFNSEASPFVFDVDETTKEIVIDLARPPQ